LIGPETVNTLPPETMDAFRDHGRVASATVKEGLPEAETALKRLASLGVDLDAITEKLQQDGVAAFAASFDQLMAALEKKRKTMIGAELTPLDLQLGPYQKRVQRRLQQFREIRLGSRLWDKDYRLWSDAPQPELADRLGWLELPESMEKEVERLRWFADEIKGDGFTHVVLLGMGGSSLAPEVFQQTFGNASGYPELRVLDSTHPAAVKAVEARIDLARTVLVVSSKSGTTLETNSFFYYFWHRLQSLTDQPGRHFVAVTDAGTPLETLARERNFRATFHAPEEVGGRYAALTAFGLVPAALIGVDIGALLVHGRRMSQACGAAAPEGKHPAILLGATLAELTAGKRDKVTFLCSRALAAFPAWLEQLIAESTGKDRKGIVPVATEPLAAPESYGADRFFVYLRLEGDENHRLDRQVAALQANGHPVARIELKDKNALGQEFFRWEFAVAAAGAAMGINPFNQPDVQLAKDLAKQAMSENVGVTQRVKGEIAAADAESLRTAVKSWLQKHKARDYIAVQAYLNPSPENVAALERICAELQQRLGAAVTLGFGPRFLHSTGQLHKGGPNTVLALQIVDEPAENLMVPETRYSFNALIRAQALGDFLALKQRRRRVLRVNLGTDGAAGLARLAESLRP
jgi:transaldolase/glucose-6-phosphate isomerase